MRLKRKIQRIFDLVMLGLLLAGMSVLLGFVNYEQNDTACERLIINLHHGESGVLISKADIDTLILVSSGDIVGRPLRHINTELIERSISLHPYILEARVYESITGDVHVHAFQRQPVLRVLTEKNTSYYIDEHGVVLPYSPDYPVRVQIASGYIPGACFRDSLHFDGGQGLDSVSNKPLLSGLYQLALFIRNDPFFEAQVEQIYVNKMQEFELIPKVGNHIVLLGDTTRLREKFHDLLVFYKEGLNMIGWNKYKIINVKYKNQVVCSKI